jgi:hypothetical protein
LMLGLLIPADVRRRSMTGLVEVAKDSKSMRNRPWR